MVINSWVSLVHGTDDGHMVVCCNPSNGDIFTFQHTYPPGKAFFFHSIFDDVISET